MSELCNTAAVITAVAGLCDRPELDVAGLRVVVQALLAVGGGAGRGAASAEETSAEGIAAALASVDSREGLRSFVLACGESPTVGAWGADRRSVLIEPGGGASPSVVYFTRPEDLPLIHNTELEGASERDEGVFKWLISPETGSDDLEVGIGWLKPGEVHILHHHLDESEFYYVLEGSSTITVNGQAERVLPSASVYIPAGVTHSIVNDSEGMCVLLFGYNMHCRTTVFDE